MMDMNCMEEASESAGTMSGMEMPLPVYHFVSKMHIIMHCIELEVFIWLHINIASTPLNVTLSQESSSSISVTWDHPCSGPPANHYVISYLFVQSGTEFLTHSSKSQILPKTNTSTVFGDVHFSHGSIHMVVVTSVSHVEASKLEYMHICKCNLCYTTCLSYIFHS